MTTSLHTLSLTFDLPLRHHQLPAFRGALAHLAGLDQDLFHNHDNGDSPGAHQHRYPLIQYRVHQGNASVFCLNEGARALEALMDSPRATRFSLNGRPRRLEWAGILRDPGFEPEVAARELPYRYRIYRYLPFSDRRMRDYQQAPDMHAKIDLLAGLLRNHIVAFAYGVGWELPKDPDRRVSVRISDFLSMRKVQVKDQTATTFDLEFRTNARLPEGVGLGRKTAFGFGAAVPVKRNEGQ